MPTADIAATATAEASPANAMTCVKPFTIPDRWIEKQTPPWDPDDTFDMYDNKGNPLADPDIYIPATDKPNLYGLQRRRATEGMEVLLKADNGHEDRAELLLPLGNPREQRRHRTTGATSPAATPWSCLSGTT